MLWDFVGRSVFAKIRNGRGLGGVLGRVRMWEQRSCGEISPEPRCERCLLTGISALLPARKSSVWGKVRWNLTPESGARARFKVCCGKVWIFSSLLECSREGRVTIIKNTRSVFNLKRQCLNLAELQTTIKLKAVTILESKNPAKAPKVLCKIPNIF